MPVKSVVVSRPTKLPPKKLFELKLLALMSALPILMFPTKLLAVTLPLSDISPEYVNGPVPDLPKL